MDLGAFLIFAILFTGVGCMFGYAIGRQHAFVLDRRQREQAARDSKLDDIHRLVSRPLT